MIGALLKLFLTAFFMGICLVGLTDSIRTNRPLRSFIFGLGLGWAIATIWGNFA